MNLLTVRSVLIAFKGLASHESDVKIDIKRIFQKYFVKCTFFKTSPDDLTAGALVVVKMVVGIGVVVAVVVVAVVVVVVVAVVVVDVVDVVVLGT